MLRIDWYAIEFTEIVNGSIFAKRNTSHRFRHYICLRVYMNYYVWIFFSKLDFIISSIIYIDYRWLLSEFTIGIFKIFHSTYKVLIRDHNVFPNIVLAQWCASAVENEIYCKLAKKFTVCKKKKKRKKDLVLDRDYIVTTTSKLFLYCTSVRTR